MKGPWTNEHERIRELLALAAAGALGEDERSNDRGTLLAAAVDRHIANCEECAAEFEHFRALAAGLRRLPTPQPSPVLVERVRARMAEVAAAQSEKRWNQGVLVFLVLFSWTITLAGWPIVRLATQGVAGWLDVQFRGTWADLIWYTALTWLTAGVAAGVFAWQKRRERRLA